MRIGGTLIGVVVGLLLIKWNTVTVEDGVPRSPRRETR